MKKILLWIIPSVVVAVFLVSFIFVLNVRNNQTDKKVYAESIQFKYDKLALIKNNNYTLTNEDFIIKPANCNQKVLISTNNTDLLEVNTLTGEITAKDAGTCKLFASIKSGENNVLQIDIDVEITEPQKPERQINVNFELSQSVGLITFEPTSVFEDYINPPTIVSGEENISIFYFEHGKITIVLHQVGTATICLENSIEKVYYVITIT